MQFLDIANKLLRRLNEVELTVDNWNTARGFHKTAKDSVNAALWDINNQTFEWPFNHITTTQTLTPMVGIYALPEVCKSVDWDTFRIRKEGSTPPLWAAKTLTYMDYDDWTQNWRAIDENATTGNLPEFVFRTQNLEFGITRIPDKAYVVEYEYWVPYVELVNPTDEPTIPDDYIPVLINGAMKYVYLFRENNDGATLADTDCKAGIKTMRTILENRYTDMRTGQIPGRG